MSEVISRRSFGRVVGLSGLGTVTRATAGGGNRLDLGTKAARLNAFLKVYTSVGRERVWYWYSGVIDATVPGGAVVPMVGVDTLIRREMVPLGGGKWSMEMFEGSYFHPVGDARPLTTMHNPLNGREVQPFPYREGPYRVGYDVSGPYDLKTGLPYPGAPPFTIDFRQAGDQFWFSRDGYIDVAHPLPMAHWPLESSGPRQTTGSFATHWASAREVADPRVATARSAFQYEAFMDWLPWMLMGQAPGKMVWRAYGSKLGTITDLPIEAHAGFMATHPRLFDERPWTEFANMFTDYTAQRTPITR